MPVFFQKNKPAMRGPEEEENRTEVTILPFIHFVNPTISYFPKRPLNKAWKEISDATLIYVNTPDTQLKNFVIDSGLVSRKDVESAEKTAKEKGQPLGDALVSSGAIGEDDLRR